MYGPLVETGTYGEFIESIILARAYDHTIRDHMQDKIDSMNAMGCTPTWQNPWGPEKTFTTDYGRPVPLGVVLFASRG